MKLTIGLSAAALIYLGCLMLNIDGNGYSWEIFGTNFNFIKDLAGI